MYVCTTTWYSKSCRTELGRPVPSLFLAECHRMEVYTFFPAGQMWYLPPKQFPPSLKVLTFRHTKHTFAQLHVTHNPAGQSLINLSWMSQDKSYILSCRSGVAWPVAFTAISQKYQHSGPTKHTFAQLRDAHNPAGRNGAGQSLILSWMPQDQSLLGSFLQVRHGPASGFFRNFRRSGHDLSINATC